MADERAWTITGTGKLEVIDDRDEVIERGTPLVTSGPKLDPFERVTVVPAELHLAAEQENVRLRAELARVERDAYESGFHDGQEDTSGWTGR